MEDDNNLPVLHESEQPSAVERLRTQLARRDGFLSPSNAHVPEEAADVGENAHVAPNPRAVDLGYEPAEATVQEFEGHTYLSDGRVGPSADIGIDSDNFIEDVTEWA